MFKDYKYSVISKISGFQQFPTICVRMSTFCRVGDQIRF